MHFVLEKQVPYELVCVMVRNINEKIIETKKTDQIETAVRTMCWNETRVMKK